jgi:hypothetical protein
MYIIPYPRPQHRPRARPPLLSISARGNSTFLGRTNSYVGSTVTTTRAFTLFSQNMVAGGFRPLWRQSMILKKKQGHRRIQYHTQWVTLPVLGSVPHHRGLEKLVPPQHNYFYTKNNVCCRPALPIALAALFASPLATAIFPSLCLIVVSLVCCWASCHHRSPSQANDKHLSLPTLATLI